MKAIRCIICTIGDEIIDGRTLDTNSQAIARFLASININVTRLLSIGDTANEITSLYAKEAKNFDIIITTGGLGPTEDDKTRQSLGKALKWTFEVNQKWLDYLVQTWGFPKEKLISQALLPENATLIENHHGTSCGFIKQEGEQIFIFLPGVPNECLSMLEPIANYLMSVDQNLEIKKKDKICIHGIYEREIDETLQNIRIKNNLNITWGLYPGLTQVKVYIYGTDLDEKMTINLLKKKYSRHLFSGCLIDDLKELLIAQNISLTVSGGTHALYLQWLLMCKGIILSDQDPAKTRITFELNHKGSNFQAKLLHKETKVLYQKDKDVIGKKESTIAQKSCFWAISDLVLYLKSSIEVSKLAT